MAAKKEGREFIDRSKDYKSDRHADEGNSEDEDSSYGPYASFDQSAEGKLLESQQKTTQLIVKKAKGRTITRLKQPRDLYALSRDFQAQMFQRWPSEVQVLAQRPNHIYYVPATPESLYKPVKDARDAPRSTDIQGKVVYDNSPDLEVKYFTRSKVGGKTVASKPHYRLQGPDDKTLLFESRFESGNLMRAIKIGEYDYELWLRFDLYTKKHTQWFYFRVQNARTGVLYRFTIMHFVKAGSLYNDGMRPLVYSEHDAETKGIGWTRVGTKIKYYKNDIKFVDGNKERYYYSLTWSCSFPNENDTYYFAHCYPYTYSDLQDYLAVLSSDPVRSRVCKQRILCRTLAGNHVYVLTITAPTRRRNEAEMKKAVVITARVHPGETNSSWMMKGFLDFLTSNAQDAKILRENFIFKIVPMLNPDGVIVGNYRCSLAGRDLNRNYKTVLKDSFPPIWHTRAMIRKLQEEREVLMFCDLHGHSRKKNIFIYGCENRGDKLKRFWERVFPHMLAKNAKDKFSINYCRFKVQKNKEGTGRIFMWNFGIPNSITMEASFCGSSLGNRKGYHFSVADYESMAHHFCDTLLDYCDPDRSKFYAVLSEIEGVIKLAILAKLKITQGKEDDDIDIDSSLDLLSEIESDSGGSDSSVSDGLPMQLLHASVPELSRKKRLRTKKERNQNRSKNSKSKENGTSKMQEDESAAAIQKESRSSRNDRKILEQCSAGSAKGRIGYTRRESTPHYAKDRVVEKTKLKKEYLEVLTNSFVNSGADEFINLQGIPHCRYTAGISSLYQNQKSCTTCERCYRSLSEESDEEAKYVSQKGKQGSESAGYFFEHDANANSVLDLAKRITVYNHRLNQSPPRGRRLGGLSPTQLRSMWQRHVNNQYEDLELGVTTNESKRGSDGSKWSNHMIRSGENRHFQISREKRPTTNGGITAQSRVNNHFEIKKAKSTPNTKVRATGNTNKSSGRRRLPHLKRNEDVMESSSSAGSTATADPSQRHYTNTDLRNEDLTLERFPTTNSIELVSEENPKSGSKHRDTMNQRSDNDRETMRTDTSIFGQISPRVDQDEVAMLKEKMLGCGATGLVSYVLSEKEIKKKEAAERLNDVTFRIPDLPINPHELHQDISSISLKESSGFTKNKREAPIEALQNSDLDLNIRSNAERSYSIRMAEMELKPPARGATFHGTQEKGPSSSVRKRSESQRTRDKVRNILGRHENAERERKTSENELKSSFKRANTNIDILGQGLVTLNVNLNIMPVISNTIDESKPARTFEETETKHNQEPSKNEVHVETLSQGHEEAQKTWVAEDVSYTMGNSPPSNAKPISLRFNGKEAKFKQTYKSKTGKVNPPPQLRRVKRTQKGTTP